MQCIIIDNFKKVVLLLLLSFSLTSCDFLGLGKRFDKAKAEKMINEKKKGNLNHIDEKACNAKFVVLFGGDYLFIVNTFDNGDFDGYVYSETGNLTLDRMNFVNIYVTHYDSPGLLWTKVYGKWWGGNKYPN